MMSASPRRAAGASLLAGAAACVLATATPLLGAAESGDKAKMDLGRQVFTRLAEPNCGVCHTLADAGTKGEIGAKLEELQPDEPRVRQAVRAGLGVMPRYDDKLTREQIDAVAYYVSRVTRGAK